VEYLEEDRGSGCPAVSNKEIAEELLRIADLLEARGNGHLAYRAAGDRVTRAGIDIHAMVESGRERLIDYFPGIGEKFRVLVTEFVRTGRTGIKSQLEREAAGLRRTV
jgi:DNA polymerase/3'-5' exonuclease PolX